MGLGRFGGGAGATRWLARQGAHVTLTDRADFDTLQDALEKLSPPQTASPDPNRRLREIREALQLEAIHLGGHHEADFLDSELIVVNPAVRPDHPLLKLAREKGIPTTTEIGLFLDACPAPVVGITGSNGKSTTAAMTAAALRTTGKTVWLGGNVGGSLLDDFDRITAEDWVVLELSSFQLAHLAPNIRMPSIAVVTNFTPNHLDWHTGLEDYRRAKQRLLTGPMAAAQIVLGPSLSANNDWKAKIADRFVPLVDRDQIPPLLVPGLHNRINAQCAATVARTIGADETAVDEALKKFPGLPGRLETIAKLDGRTYINDTTSTTAESTAAALRAFAETGPKRNTWLLAGGAEKGTDLSLIPEAAVKFAQGAAFFGRTGQQLYEEAIEKDSRLRCARFETLDEALVWCEDASRPGGRILLSPGCSSHDQFSNFQQRGAHFTQLILSKQKIPTKE